MIEALNLSRNYGAIAAAKNISFKISKGEVVGLLGPNGAGKTTVMKMLTGFLEPSSGSAIVSNLNVEENKNEAQKLIGYLPENTPVYREMTVAQYLEFVCQLRGINELEINTAISRALNKTQLVDRANQLIGTLSKGYQQRVGVAQAIIHQPAVLILDEPTNGLDPSQILEMRNLIKELAQTSTIILSTHIMQEVDAVCDRVLMIVKGELVVDSTIAKLRSVNKLTVSCSGLADAKKIFSEILGVQQVSQLSSPEEFSLTLKEQASVREVSALASSAVISKGGSLYSIAQEQRSLESIFREVSGH